MAGLILAIDQGTTNTKALLVDRTGAPVFRTAAPVPLNTCGDGFVEQDPDALWQSVLEVMSTAHSHVLRNGYSIEAVAISNQRETALVWDAETGHAAAAAVSWQCVRGTSICNRLSRHADLVRSATGLPLAPLISASKWAWLIENDTAVQSLCTSGSLCLGTVDSWLIHKLTSHALHVTDLTNASRTGLLDLSTLQWHPGLRDLFGIPAHAMPALHCSSGDFGHCTGVNGFKGVPILAIIGDSHAALLGQGIFTPGIVKATYGTGSSLMALTAQLAADMPSLARTVAWSTAGDTRFALEGNIAMTGAAIQWLGEFLGLTQPAAEVAALAETVMDSNGVYFVPAMVGLGAPHWDAEARGAISGLSRSHTAAHLARAVLQAVAFQIADVFFEMERASGQRFTELRADGGATRNTSLMQFQADILGRPVLRSVNEELSAIGAAWLAGIKLGWWENMSALEAMNPATERFDPSMDGCERARLYRGWQKAVQSVSANKEATA